MLDQDSRIAAPVEKKRELILRLGTVPKQRVPEAQLRDPDAPSAGSVALWMAPVDRGKGLGTGASLCSAPATRRRNPRISGFTVCASAVPGHAAPGENRHAERPAIVHQFDHQSRACLSGEPSLAAPLAASPRHGRLLDDLSRGHPGGQVGTANVAVAIRTHRSPINRQRNIS